MTGMRVNSNAELQQSIEDSLSYLTSDVEKLKISENKNVLKLQTQPSIDERECCGLFQILPVRS